MLLCYGTEERPGIANLTEGCWRRERRRVGDGLEWQHGKGTALRQHEPK